MPTARLEAVNLLVDFGCDFDLPNLEVNDILVEMQEGAYSCLPPVCNKNGAPNFDACWEIERFG
jgi:hypothetical protein